MTKPQLLALANAKDARMKELRKKLSKFRVSIARYSYSLIDFRPNSIEERKAALVEARAALAAAHVVQTADTAVLTLVPKPHGTSGRAGFNLANAMGMDIPVYHEIQVSA